ncbi:hypothetical protein [Spirosoma utsteinense]|uniref:hypothetical protein n=1 Tax=Spirosoma utsteinense TaxID=2585773 RepID=UPI0016476987|nr:hypothetical protein [Spirosoma utsteinense]MBC3785714.1 hypothetical protein [Spirosoma utsteinense]
MLNQLIARYVANTLSPLNGPIISRLAGLVKTLETDAYTPGKAAKFPVALDSEANPCTGIGKRFPDLVPDQKERLIVYLEDGGSSNNGGKWTSRLRLIGWGNADLLTGADGVLTAVLIAKIERLLKTIRAPADSPISSLRCEIVGTPSSSVNLFQNYTYTETRSQFLLPPYFAFGLDLSISFTLNLTCYDSLTGLTPDECA